jgi:hypothetical protein
METGEMLKFLLELLKTLDVSEDYQFREDVKKALASKLIEINCLG